MRTHSWILVSVLLLSGSLLSGAVKICMATPPRPLLETAIDTEALANPREIYNETEGREAYLAKVNALEPTPLGTIQWIDTTNPYKNWTQGDPLNEWGIAEGCKCSDTVLALDEEAVSRWGIDYCIRAVERSDEALVHTYSIDIRINEVITYDSDDSIIWFSPEYGSPSLYDEAWNEFGQDRLRNQHKDLVIMITGQATMDSWVAGLAPVYPTMGWNTMMACRLVIQWVDDNLIQHEMAHCFYCPDHHDTIDMWCSMAAFTDYVWFLCEDGVVYDYFMNIRRLLMTYDWCSRCNYCLTDSPQGSGGHIPSLNWPWPL